MKILKTLLIAGLALLGAGLQPAPAAAAVDVITTDQTLASITRSMGGNLVSVDYLATSGQDPHLVEPRPSQVVKLSRADMVVRTGLDLDLWFDSLLRAAGNGKIVFNAPGHVNVSRGIWLLDIPQGKLDPSQGDIHVYGNPHFIYGPSSFPTVAQNIRDGLKRVDPKNAATYDANLAALVKRHGEAIAGWKRQMQAHRGKPVVTYHRSLVYLLAEFGLRDFGNVEPRPGLQPTPGHVSRLATTMKEGGAKVILTESYRPRRYADLLAKQSGAKIVVLPGGVGAEKGTDDYFAWMDVIVDRVAAAL